MVFGFGAAEIVVVGQHAELGKVIVDKGKPFPIVAAERLVYDCIDKLSGEPLDKRPELSPEIASAVKFPDKLISSLLSGILCLIVIVRLQALNQLVDNSPVKLVALLLISSTTSFSAALRILLRIFLLSSVSTPWT